MPPFRRTPEPSPEPVPQLAGPGPGPLVVDGVHLPPGHAVAADMGRGPVPTTLWIADADVGGVEALWLRFAAAHPRTGLWLLVLTGLFDQPERSWAIGSTDRRFLNKMQPLHA